MPKTKLGPLPEPAKIAGRTKLIRKSAKRQAPHDGQEETLPERSGVGREIVEPPTRIYHKVEDTAAQWMLIKAANPQLTQREIANMLGLTVKGLGSALSEAKKRGLLKFEKPLDDLRHNIIPKAVQNLDELLDAKDKKATIETLKGTLFKAYQAAEGIQDIPNLALAIKIEMPEGPAAPMKGQIFGTPREFGEVIDVRSESDNG